MFNIELICVDLKTNYVRMYVCLDGKYQHVGCAKTFMLNQTSLRLALLVKNHDLSDPEISVQ